MAHRGFLATAFLCLLLCLSFQGNAIDVSKYEGKMEYQHTSIVYAESLALANKYFATDSNDNVTVVASTRVAILITKIEGAYYGAKATLNVYGLPSVTDNQISGSQISIRNGGDLIVAGWHVYPELYGDHDTHFFVLWRSGQQKKECYNLKCEGFKRDDASPFVPGYKVRPLSVYNGAQYQITLKIKKSLDTGDWWLYYGPNGDQPVGYWPKSLFTTLANKASQIYIGGVVTFKRGGPSPPMGSGHFAVEGYKKATYVKNIQFVDQDGLLYKPESDTLTLVTDRSKCYGISTVDSVDAFYFGGPGGCN